MFRFINQKIFTRSTKYARIIGQIYVNVSLASYVENDKITINKKKLNEIQFKKEKTNLIRVGEVT